MSERLLFGGKSRQALPWNPLPHMDEWLDNLAADETSIGYIRAAKVGLAHFSTFAASQNIQHPDDITRHHILRFQAYLTELRKSDGTPLALSYRQQLLKYLGAWIHWLEEVEHIERSPWVRIKVGRVSKQPKPLEDDEVSLLFEAHKQQAFSITPFSYHRREVILVLLFGWGLRIGELEALTVSAMDMRLDYVTSRNKSRPGAANSTKVLPYGDEMKAVVGRWLRIRAGRAQVGEDSLLIDHYGKPLTSHVIRKIVNELGRRAGVAVNPHRLRDTFGTVMLDGDVPVERIMKMMGHTNRAQTLAYSRVNDPKVKESHDAVMQPLITKLLGGAQLLPKDLS